MRLYIFLDNFCVESEIIMKNNMSHKSLQIFRLLIITCVFVLVFTSSTFATSQYNDISEKEALDLAIFYYCCNTTDPISFNEYVITPLYDETGKITYYCIDFFENKSGKGYVLIGKNLTDLQCSELALEGSSSYYINSQNNQETIYYNPFEIFTEATEENVYSDISGQEINKTDINGNVYDGNAFKNRNLLNVVEDSVSPVNQRDSYEIDPSIYLQSLGFTNVSCLNYGTLETVMNQAGAFNYMYDIPSGGKPLADGSLLFNSGHCAITAIANIFMYYKHINQLNDPPANYLETFTDVCNIACDLGYFSKTRTYNPETGEYEDQGVSHANVISLLGEVALYYGSGSFISDAHEADWYFLTEKIDAGSPVYLRFGHANPMNANDEYVYSYHATVAFGYTRMQGHRNGATASYSFVKLFDGWDYYRNDPDGNNESSGKRYICWQALINSETNLEIDENGNVIDHSIAVDMYTIWPGRSDWQ